MCVLLVVDCIFKIHPTVKNKGRKKNEVRSWVKFHFLDTKIIVFIETLTFLTIYNIVYNLFIESQCI